MPLSLSELRTWTRTRTWATRTSTTKAELLLLLLLWRTTNTRATEALPACKAIGTSAASHGRTAWLCAVHVLLRRRLLRKLLLVKLLELLLLLKLLLVHALRGTCRAVHVLLHMLILSDVVLGHDRYGRDVSIRGRHRVVVTVALAEQAAES